MFQGKHTNARAGQDTFGGWHNSAIDLFKALRKENAAARAKAETIAMEKSFLAELRASLGITHATADEEKRAKRRKKITDVDEEEEKFTESDNEMDYNFAEI